MESDSIKILDQFELIVKTGQIDDIQHIFNVQCLKQYSAIDTENIRRINGIFRIYLQRKTTLVYNKWIADVVDLLISNITALRDNEESLKDLLDLLKSFLERLNHLPNAKEILLEVVVLLLSQENSLEILRNTVDVFLLIPKFGNINDVDDFKECALKLLNATNESIIQIRICEILIGYQLTNAIPEMLEIYQILIMVVNNSSKQNNVSYCLKAICAMYKSCKEKLLLVKLSALVAENMNIFLRFLNDEEHKSHVAVIFAQLAKHLFSTCPFSGNIEEELCKPFEDSSFRFIVYYLEVTFCNIQHENQLILGDLAKTCLESSNLNLMQNSAVEKCIYLLFAAYMANDSSEKSQKLNAILLKALQNKSDLYNYITYHVAQLTWILSKGSPSLKLKVLELWIKNVPNKILIANCVCKVGSEREFIHKILATSCDRNHLLPILNIIKDNCNSFAKIVRDEIVTCLKVEMIEFLMHLGPSLAESEQGAIFLTGKLLNLWLNGKIDSKCKLELFIYLNGTLLKFPNCKEIVEKLLNVEFISCVVKYGSTGYFPIEKVVGFLKHVVILQKRHNLRSEKKLVLNNCFLDHSPQVLSNILKLIVAVVTSEYCILQFPSVPFVMYSELLNLLNTKDHCEVAFKIVCYMMHYIPALSTSSLNTSVIICQSSKNCFTSYFIEYVKLWLTKNPQGFLVPSKQIKKILSRELKTSLQLQICGAKNI